VSSQVLETWKEADFRQRSKSVVSTLKITKRWKLHSVETISESDFVVFPMKMSSLVSS
jgi:hypothetical protein